MIAFLVLLAATLFAGLQEGLQALLQEHRVSGNALDYIGSGINFSSRPLEPSSSSQIAPSGPCSTSRMRRPIE